MQEWDVVTPCNVAELTEILSRQPGKLIAGGTDLIPRLRRAPAAQPVCLIDLSRLSELSFIREQAGQIEIGALTTHAQLFTSSLLIQGAPALSKACASIGSPQTRARGTLGGNLCNASPAADTAAPLLCLDAEVQLAGRTGPRRLALNDFFIGPGKTGLLPGEYLHSIHFSLPTGLWGAAYEKLGRRNGMAIAVASAAVLLTLSASGQINRARIALGSVASRPVRSPHAETILIGRTPDSALLEQAAQAMLADISPIADIRASREYRMHAAHILLLRALEEALSQAQGRRK
jgi:CO/xanthine dehydrogenase FAD-binding subunit